MDLIPALKNIEFARPTDRLVGAIDSHQRGFCIVENVTQNDNIDLLPQNQLTKEEQLVGCVIAADAKIETLEVDITRGTTFRQQFRGHFGKGVLEMDALAESKGITQETKAHGPRRFWQFEFRAAKSVGIGLVLDDVA